MAEVGLREILEHSKAFSVWISGGLGPSSTAHHLLRAAILLKTLGAFRQMPLFCFFFFKLEDPPLVHT